MPTPSWPPPAHGSGWQSRWPDPVTPPPSYRVRRSTRARRARLTVARDGEVVVVLPSRAPAALAAALVGEHRDWIARQVARTAAERARIGARPPLTAGRTLVVHGIPHRVRHEPVAGRGGVSRTLGSDEEGIVGEIVVRSATPEDLPRHLERWLRAEARRTIERRVAERAPEVGVRPGPVSIRAQSSRWGSAAANGALSFNWRLLLAPPYVLDAVVVHELGHLVVRGHSARFWSLVRGHAPRTDEARAWLRAHHAELLAALD